jgi:predicted nucleic acid-binding protein
MPTGAEGRAEVGAARWAVDTSVAVGALDASHTSHTWCVAVVRDRRPALAGHAAFETYSVLTRMPGRRAVDAATTGDLLRRAFPVVLWPAADTVAKVLERFARLGVTGGAVYDALVGTAALEHGRTLLTRDQRARRTYDLLGVDHEFVGPT